MSNSIAFYMRLSIEEQRDFKESNSISGQRLLINDFVMNDDNLKTYQGIEYVDDGYSGTNINRPAFSKLLEDIRNGEIKCIIVKDFSRFLRDYILIGDYLENILPFLGIRFISINDGYDSSKHRDNTTSLDIQFRNLLNDFYSKDISLKVKSSLSTQKKQGKFLSTRQPAYGYMLNPKDKHSIIIDREVAETVKRIFQLYAEGVSTKSIVSLLNKENVSTPQYRKWQLTGLEYAPNLVLYKKQSSTWTENSVLKILRNEIYIGNYIFNTRKVKEVGGKETCAVDKREWGRVNQNHEPLISKELFDKVANIRNSKNKFKEKNRDYEWLQKSPLQKKVRCYQCGHILHCGNFKEKGSGGNLHYVKRFRCRICPQRGDLSNSIKATLLEEMVKKEIERNFRIEKIVIDYDQNEDVIKKKIIELEDQKDLKFEQYKNGKISKDDFKKEKYKIDTRKEDLQNQLLKVKKVNQIKNDKEGLNNEHIINYIDCLYIYNKEIKEIIYKKEC